MWTDGDIFWLKCRWKRKQFSLLTFSVTFLPKTIKTNSYVSKLWQAKLFTSWRQRVQAYMPHIVGPILLGHSGPLCRCRCRWRRRGHRCAGGVRQCWRATVATPGKWACGGSRSGEWVQHFLNASCWVKNNPYDGFCKQTSSTTCPVLQCPPLWSRPSMFSLSVSVNPQTCNCNASFTSSSAMAEGPRDALVSIDYSRGPIVWH